ncbi:7-carboxy-7-deazaguanine synthase [Lachnotalea glycerini]|jgi:7-carboxy-7-deazaguanine synthase|uniref:7-carboxy-7-deazaguanine synthase n=1 Tax=Lachnotalea glycerini TaxID=1763509 RepID=A0A255IRP1_9FIRM|nr:putative 7-carboxy-7-deazaguanine synthase QueE [Lachnotalea glycerini]PXV87772.1 7-carboxy-7-deazaguanine synthase [Lachnotalea glycerini]RDY32062.1 putative 7-carboxy-7-deazaguanine synthase QueE [Lachnotalea glycerini]
MSKYKVVEKFVSINGEGVLAGQLAVFIRFKGCNLNCSYCDTAWANQKDAAYTLMSDQQIYNYIKETGVKNVTLTGGEPLQNPNIIQLIQMLTKDTDLQVEIETNGSIDLSMFAAIDHAPSFTMDYKLASSMMESEMLVTNFKLLKKKDTVKFVVGNLQDLDRARDIITANQLMNQCHVYISTVYNKIDLVDVVNYMIKHSMNGVTLQLQMHKIIWEPNQRGV